MPWGVHSLPWVPGLQPSAAQAACQQAPCTEWGLAHHSLPSKGSSRPLNARNFLREQAAAGSP